ncbi:unnamed protein product [Mytilus edulis]|uniref:CCHC-type domain-containing protein n=1 Tax=Mytilus edulis TaxID=6550 RepID=A0A8S3V3K2_MYTED|nr:unnamed protein product [Mytilus edulis]
METENDGYDGYQYESNSQDGDSQYGDGITINKTIARHLTAKITKTSPLQKENLSDNIQKEKLVEDKITTTDILTHLQTITNVSDLIKCLQRINQDLYMVTCKDSTSLQTFLGKFAKFQIGNTEFTTEKAGPLQWENKKDFIDVLIYGMPFEVKPAISGVRIVRIASMEKPIPRKIYIQGQLVTIRYEGQQNLKKCYKCNEYGLAIDCRNEPKRKWEQKDYCFKCGRYGHKSTECYNDKNVPYTNNTDDNGNSDKENPKSYDISQYAEKKQLKQTKPKMFPCLPEMNKFFETESDDIVENVEIHTQIKENEQMENKNIEAKKKKDKTKAGKKKAAEKTEDKDKTKVQKLHTKRRNTQ